MATAMTDKEDIASAAASRDNDTPENAREKHTRSGSNDGIDTVPTAFYDNSDDDSRKVEDDRRNHIPWRYKLMAGWMILLFAFGSSFSESTFGPLKSTLVEELDITNAQYGAIASASSLVNTILPIVGGIYMDHWGATYAAIISSVFILIGAIISASGANVGHVGLVIGGRILLGFGSTVIESTQNKLFAHWFAGSHLALAFGVDIAWSRITTIISRSSAVPMSMINGWWGWALWIPTIVCAANLALCIGYWAFERSLPKQYRPPLGKDARVKEGWSKRYFGLKTLYDLPLLFWVVCGTQVPQNAAVSVYSSNLADIQRATRGTNKLAAGYNSSLQGVIPIVLTPAVGAFFDRFGWRIPFVSFTGALYVVVFALIGLTTVHPLAPILLGSFALSTNAITFIASIPVLVGDDALLGTAFGVWKAFNNCNSIILEVSAGAIQDRSGGSYNNVIYLIIAIKAWQVVLGPIYDYLDGRWLGHALRRPESKRLAMHKAAEDEGAQDVQQYKGWRPSRTGCMIVGTELVCAIIVAWVLYIVYAIGT